MDWRGIEWAVPIFEIVMIGLPIYGFVTFYRRVKRGTLKKLGALWRYALLVIAPTIIYVLFFFVLVGIEELTRMSPVSEGLARSAFVLVGLGVSVWLTSILAFGATLAFMRN